MESTENCKENAEITNITQNEIKIDDNSPTSTKLNSSFDDSENNSSKKENYENSDSQSDLEEHNYSKNLPNTPKIDETIPKIETQLKKNKLEVKPKRVKVDKPKIKKVKGDPKAKSKPKKSAMKVALELWYENMLSEMVIKVKRKPRNFKNEVQCVCGDLSQEGIVNCKECKKMQHPACLGYKGKLSNYICPQCWLNKVHVFHF